MILNDPCGNLVSTKYSLRKVLSLHELIGHLLSELIRTDKYGVNEVQTSRDSAAMSTNSSYNRLGLFSCVIIRKSYQASIFRYSLLALSFFYSIF